MIDSTYQAEINRILIKCLGLKFPVTPVRTEVGPRVVTHYFRPAPGSSAPLSNIMGKYDDIAMSCNVKSCIITRHGGELGFAIPLENPKTIEFMDALTWLTTNPAITKDMAIPLLMGQTPTGDFYTLDLATQPHMLIAGSTGSGKSIFVASLLSALSILKEPKTELDMFLVDTKQLDFTPFKGLPHVRHIVTDVRVLHQVLDSLMKLVRKRTEDMKGTARNLKEWNDLMIKYGHPEERMAYKLLVIDEIADVIDSDRALGRTVKQRRETGESENKGDLYIETIKNKLQSLAQISRAAGIHIIAATQRPSVEIVDGDLKANLPMRLTFGLPTSADSRVVLGVGGAEKLLGKGDYLYQNAESQQPIRGHGPFVHMMDIAGIIRDNDLIRSTMRGVTV